MAYTSYERLNHALRRRHKFLNLAQSVLLLAGMVLLLAACGWIVAGPEGVAWTLVIGLLGLTFSPQVSPRMILAMYRAVPIRRHDLPQLHAAVAELSARAGLPRSPELYYIPSPVMNAFTVGTRRHAAVAVTDGLLRALDPRDFIGVLAHEISHIRNNDIWVMGLADMVGSLTRVMSMFGLVLLLLNLPLVLAGQATVPWPLVLLLMFAPTLVALLQLALSRTREYDADLEAAHVTGDPLGLAAALEKIERYQRSPWEGILIPARRSPDPSLLRTHPPTGERVRRLLDLASSPVRLPPPLPAGRRLQHAYPPVAARPRHRLTGLWY